MVLLQMGPHISCINMVTKKCLLNECTELFSVEISENMKSINTVYCVGFIHNTSLM